VRVPSRTTTTTSAISMPISRRISGSRTGRDWQLVGSATTHSEPCCGEPLKMVTEWSPDTPIVTTLGQGRDGRTPADLRLRVI
jgi:hypothetical protein